MTDMIETLGIPVASAPKLYPEEFKSDISSICTPIEKARAGDIVAVKFNYSYGDLLMNLHHRIEIVALSPDGKFLAVPFLYLPHQSASRISYPLLHAFQTGLHHYSLKAALAPLGYSDIGAVFFSAFIMPDVTILVDDDFSNVHPADHDIPGVGEKTISQCYRLLLPRAFASAHEAMEAPGNLGPVLRMLEDICPLYDEDDNKLRFSLKGPCETICE